MGHRLNLASHHGRHQGRWRRAVYGLRLGKHPVGHQTGRIRRRQTNLRHILEKKAPGRKRRLSGDADLAPGDAARISRILNNH